tara:strand:- start:2716 stop:3003 length:288 start_codon:yes stop_codon:yes gene_type:complete
MARFKLQERVIVVHNGINRVGLITDRTTKMKRRVFNLLMEDGTRIPYVPVDVVDETVYIDSVLSKTIAPLIDTNLHASTKGNVRKGASPIPTYEL